MRFFTKENLKWFREWELLVFFLTAICITVFLFTDVLHPWQDSSVSMTSSFAYTKKPPTTLHIVTPISGDKIRPPKLENPKNPFYIQVPQKDSKQKTTDNKRKGEKNPETPEKDKSKPKKPAPTFKIKYCGTISHAGGPKYALIENIKSEKMTYLKVNSNFLHLKIINFDADNLTVKLPSGATRTVDFDNTLTYKLK